MLTAGDQSGDPHLLDWVKVHEAARQNPGTKGYVAPVHFLDRPVSGAVLFALSTKGASRLGAQFRDRSIRKVYLVVVEPQKAVPFKLGQAYSLTDYLLKDPVTNRVKVVPPPRQGQTNQSQLCTLSFKVLRESAQAKLLEVELGTGRSHQIRVQLAHQGLPVAGDLKYGSNPLFAQPSPSQKHSLIALHAYKLQFQQPVGGDTINVAVPPPAAWYQAFGPELFYDLRESEPHV